MRACACREGEGPCGRGVPRTCAQQACHHCPCAPDVCVDEAQHHILQIQHVRGLQRVPPCAAPTAAATAACRPSATAARCPDCERGGSPARRPAVAGAAARRGHRRSRLATRALPLLLLRRKLVSLALHPRERPPKLSHLDGGSRRSGLGTLQPLLHLALVAAPPRPRPPLPRVPRRPARAARPRRCSAPRPAAPAPPSARRAARSAVPPHSQSPPGPPAATARGRRPPQPTAPPRAAAPTAAQPLRAPRRPVGRQMRRQRARGCAHCWAGCPDPRGLAHVSTSPCPSTINRAPQPVSPTCTSSRSSSLARAASASLASSALASRAVHISSSSARARFSSLCCTSVRYDSAWWQWAIGWGAARRVDRWRRQGGRQACRQPYGSSRVQAALPALARRAPTAGAAHLPLLHARLIQAGLQQGQLHCHAVPLLRRLLQITHLGCGCG